MQANDRRIFLVGLPGAGKTTLGKELAQQINMPFIDLDQAIVEHTGKNITQLFNELGEEGFRAIEHQNFESIIQKKEQFVIATGGGTPCFYNHMQIMNAIGVTIWLNTPLQVITERLTKAESERRPLLQENSLRDLLNDRKKYYSCSKYILSKPTLTNLLKLVK